MAGRTVIVRRQTAERVGAHRARLLQLLLLLVLHLLRMLVLLLLLHLELLLGMMMGGHQFVLLVARMLQRVRAADDGRPLERTVVWCTEIWESMI